MPYKISPRKNLCNVVCGLAQVREKQYFRIVFLYMKNILHISVVLLLLLCCSCSRQDTIHDSRLQAATDLLWSDTDSAAHLVSAIDTTTLNDYDYHRYVLLCAHLMLKQQQCIPEDVLMLTLAEYFMSRNDLSSMGETYYVLGAYENWIGDNSSAMAHLKRAEAAPTEDIVKGMTYYKMGRVSEAELLYEVASHYYQQALPLLVRAGHPLYIASAYRELGRTLQDTTDVQQERCDAFDSALVYANQLHDTLLYLDILYSRTAMLDPQSAAIAQISRYLCDSVGLRRYAYDLVKYYVRSEQPDSARTYLDILAADTMQAQWSRYQYLLWGSRYQHLQGRDKQAYQELLSLYLQRYGELEEDGKSQTYVIAQRYDNEVERAKNLQLQIDKQRLYITLAVVAIVVLLLTIFLIVYILYHRTQTLLERERTAQQISSLHAELRVRRGALKQVLEQRIALSKSLQEAILHKREGEPVPQWAQPFIEMNIFSTAEQWQDFLTEFNGCYEGFLTQLKQDYPELTSADLQVIALIVLGLDISDICLLLGLTQRTIWSRRLRIKTHIGIPNGMSVETWLQQRLCEE